MNSADPRLLQRSEREEWLVFAGRRRAAAAIKAVNVLRHSTGLVSDMTTDPAWFISRTVAWRNSPVILLLQKGGRPAAALLFYSRRHLGIATGVLKGGNHTGDGLVIAPAGQRLATLEAGTMKALSLPWVHTVLASLRSEAVLAGAASEARHFDWVWRSRDVSTNLSLEGGFEGFLSRLRSRSRRNYRYFRRRAERELGLAFVPHMQPEDAVQAVAELHGSALHSIPRARSTRLEAAVRATPGSFAMGVRDAGGRWVSYLSGWRQDEGTFVEWQLNHHALEAASLSTVMRTYFLEHEAANGVTKVVFVGGSSAALGRYCAPDHCLDLLATRPGVRGFVARTLMVWLRPQGKAACLIRNPMQPLEAEA